MINLQTPRGYAQVTGIILFILGFFGFAFRASVNVPDGYLFLSLILGFWGIVVGTRK